MEVQKKKSGCLKFVFIFLGAIVGFIIILAIIGSLVSDSDTQPSSQNVDSNGAPTQTQAQTQNQNLEGYFAEAQKQFNEGKYLPALEAIEKAIKVENKNEYTEFKTKIEAAIEARKGELQNHFEIKEDKVENVTFIMPSKTLHQGLFFYPYIGVEGSKKYMWLRVGFQEKASANTLFVFTKIKVRNGDQLEELKFNPLDKMSNVDLLGSGMTETVDIAVADKIQKLLESIMLNQDEVLVRFEDISNKSSDYTITNEQKQTIANILEYYSYIK